MINFFSVLHFRGMHQWHPVLKMFSHSAMSLIAFLAQAVASKIRSFASFSSKAPHPESWEPFVMVLMASKVFSESTVTSHHCFLVCD